MTPSSLSNLWLKEDWWAIWLGGILILLAFCLVLPGIPTSPEGPLDESLVSWITKPGSWDANPLTSIFPENRNLLLPLAGLLILFAALFGTASSMMGRPITAFLPAFTAVFGLTVLAYIIAGQTTIKNYGLSYVLWALVLGLLISNTLRTPEWLKPAIRTEFFIKTGLVLLGAEILFGKILQLGIPGLMVAWGVTPIIIVFMFLLGKHVLNIPARLSILIAAATSVCGVSAAIATAAACRARKEELTLTIGLSLLFTVIMMILFPSLIQMMGMDVILGGAWIGGTIDATGAVVAAGAFLGPEAEQVAAVVKMIQNVLIGLVAFLVAVYWVSVEEREAGDVQPSAMEIWTRFPKFILGFVGASLLFSSLYGLWGNAWGTLIIDEGVIGCTKTFRGWFFAMAFVCIGLESNFRDLWHEMAGGRPLLLYVIGQTANILLTLLVAWLAFSFLFTITV